MQPDAILGLVSFSVFPAEMGGQKGVADFYTYLAQRRKVVLAVYKKNPVAKDQPFMVLPILDHHKWLFTNFRHIAKLAKLIRQQPIGYIFIEHSYPAWMGWVLRRMTGKPYFIHSHNIETHRFRDMCKPLWQVYGWYEKKIHRLANHSFFITQEDRNWACTHWHLEINRTSVVTYGTALLSPLPQEQKRIYREQLLKENQLSPDTKLFLFNGTLDYLPNIDAIGIIIHTIIPLLVMANQSFRIIICGSKLGKKWEDILHATPGVLYKGFVPDIALYFRGSDCFINPVTQGAGIKTKLIDALAENLTCISTRSGARGIPQNLTGDKLICVEDNDWGAFTNAMLSLDLSLYPDTPGSFYQNFHWNTIIQQALLSLPTV